LESAVSSEPHLKFLHFLTDGGWIPTAWSNVNIYLLMPDTFFTFYLRIFRQALYYYGRTMGAAARTIHCHWGFSDLNPV
jgi:hypothetical protein